MDNNIVRHGFIFRNIKFKTVIFFDVIVNLKKYNDKDINHYNFF